MQDKARLVGINHLALEVADLEGALRFYGAIFELEVKWRMPPTGRWPAMAFFDMGDQFLGLVESRNQSPDEFRHFGLIVDHKQAVVHRLHELNVEIDPQHKFGTTGVDFHDPWGNHVQILAYSEVQFSETPEVLAAMGVARLTKSASPLAELRARGMAGQ